VGGLTSIVSAVAIAGRFHADPFVVKSFYAKSVTAPIAMGIAQQVGAAPTLTAVFAIVTGILGAALGRPIFNVLGLTPMWQRGFCLGTAAHGVGTSRAFSVSEEAGAYSSLAMGLHGVVGALVIPPLVHALFA
jgi:putative effector of murein hydrolase